MNDAIYLRKENALVEMMETPYEYESVLQEKLADHPRLLGGGQMSDGGIQRWALIAREKSVPDKKGGNEAGPQIICLSIKMTFRLSSK